MTFYVSRFQPPPTYLVGARSYILFVSTDETTDFAIWTTVEVGLGITAACAATLRPLIQSMAIKYSHNASSASRSTPLTAGGHPSYNPRHNYYRAGYRQKNRTMDGWDADTDTTVLSEMPSKQPNGASVSFATAKYDAASDEEGICVDHSVTISYSQRHPMEPLSPIDPSWPERSR